MMEAMVAIAMPFVWIVTERRKEDKLRGHVINIRQDITSFAKKLPRRIENVPYIWVNRKNRSGTQNKLFKVERKKLLALLEGLKRSDCPYYQNIEIDYDYIESLPECDVPKNINELQIPQLFSDDIVAELEEQNEEDQKINENSVIEQQSDGTENEEIVEVEVVASDSDNDVIMGGDGETAMQPPSEVQISLCKHEDDETCSNCINEEIEDKVSVLLRR